MKLRTIALLNALVLVAGGALAQGTAPTDAQIAHIVVTANQVDIDAGKLAESKAANSDVKAFGEQMVTDHTGVNKQATELAKKLKVAPEDNPTSKSLKSGGEENVKRLKTLSGAQFDKRGDAVTWVNKDPYPHTVTAPGAFDSRDIAPNRGWTYTARKAGRYDYVCTLHPTMKATLIVE
jgi:predicted outer membrane protein